MKPPLFPICLWQPFYNLKYYHMFYDLKKAASIFGELTRQDSKWNTFSAILDFSLIPFRYYSTDEDLKSAHEKLLSWPHKEKIADFLTALTDLQPESFGDPLGEFYMLHISNGQLEVDEAKCNFLLDP